MRFFQLIIAAVLVTLLTACAPTLVGPQDAAVRPATPTATSTSPRVNEADCKAKGGKVQRVCLMGNESCVIPYSDAGKVCTDGSQCQSNFCLAKAGASQNSDAPQGAVTGACKQNSNPCGCFTLVQDGKIGPGLCVD